MNRTKPHGLTGNRNAAKPKADKVTGKGRITFDAGDALYQRVSAAAPTLGYEGKGALKKTLVELLTEALDKRGL